MHANLYNEAILTIRLRPQTPLLIKAGGSGEDALDPTLPDMSFVRTQRPDREEAEVYVPGSSLRGVLRGHAEKLLRSLDNNLACDPTLMGREGRLRKTCFAGTSNTGDLGGPEAYKGSCYACKLFGNTTLAGRLRVGDLYLRPGREPVLERRYGVSIDRLTGAVAQGPFELEILTDAVFEGQLTVRNYTLGQLGLLAAALLDLGDGFVAMGFGKSRGLGRVHLSFHELAVRTLRDPQGAIAGVGSLASERDRRDYTLPNSSADRLMVSSEPSRQRGFYTLTATREEAKGWLEEAANRWVAEAAP